MSNVTKLIMLAIGVLITSVVVSYAISVQQTGKDTMNTGTDQLGESISALSNSKYDVYEGTSQVGKSVVRILNDVYNDPNIEVLVCTKDGYNFVYNTAATPIFGASTSNAGANGTASYDTASNYGALYLVCNPNDNQLLTNLPQYDAKGLPFTGTSGTIAVVQKAPVTGHVIGTSNPVATVNGYNSTVEKTDPGYISMSSYYSCSVQYDINNEPRRITFIQR